jgi:hypothetical protein
MISKCPVLAELRRHLAAESGARHAMPVAEWALDLTTIAVATWYRRLCRGDHWLAVTMLALEAHAREIVRRERVQELLDRWMPVEAPSLSAFLGRPQQTGAADM